MTANVYQVRDGGMSIRFSNTFEQVVGQTWPLWGYGYIEPGWAQYQANMSVTLLGAFRV